MQEAHPPASAARRRDSDGRSPVASPPGKPGADLFRLLVESVQDYAIFLLDPTGHVASWNAGARRIKGYTAEEIIGKHLSTFYLPEEARRGKPDYALRVAA